MDINVIFYRKEGIMLEIKNLSFNVESNNEELGIINDVSLSFERGKLIVITGPNGGGKSTIAKLIMGIEKLRVVR